MGSNNSSSGSSSSGLSPLKYNAFRAVWLAAIASNIGSLMEAVGESWLMTSLVTSSLIVALTWASDSLSITALALPAGALADIVDRRKLLIISQSWMLAIALTLAIVTIAGSISPVILLVLIFLLGLGEAISTPAFSPFLLGTVPHSEIRNAITLNGVALNIGRGIGPAVGGVLIAAIGPASVFLLNALSFAGIVIVLLRIRDNNKPTEEISQLPAERMFGAMRAGLRYVKNSPSIHSVFVRVAVFAISSSALPALLPSLSRYTLRLDSSGYGILFGLFGIGAIIGGMIIVPRAIKKMSPDHLIILATVIFSISLFILGTIHNLVVLYAAMVLAGIAQLMALPRIDLSFHCYDIISNCQCFSLDNLVLSLKINSQNFVLEKPSVAKVIFLSKTCSSLSSLFFDDANIASIDLFERLAYLSNNLVYKG